MPLRLHGPYSEGCPGAQTALPISVVEEQTAFSQRSSHLVAPRGSARFQGTLPL